MTDTLWILCVLLILAAGGEMIHFYTELIKNENVIFFFILFREFRVRHLSLETLIHIICTRYTIYNK